MPIINLPQTEEQTVVYFTEAMNRYDPESVEYKRCQHIVAHFANLIRARERSDAEVFTKHKRLLLWR